VRTTSVTTRRRRRTTEDDERDEDEDDDDDDDEEEEEEEEEEEATTTTTTTTTTGRRMRTRQHNNHRHVAEKLRGHIGKVLRDQNCGFIRPISWRSRAILKKTQMYVFTALRKTAVISSCTSESWNKTPNRKVGAAGQPELLRDRGLP
jgi:hypothetical protein